MKYDTAYQDLLLRETKYGILSIVCVNSIAQT